MTTLEEDLEVIERLARSAIKGPDGTVLTTHYVQFDFGPRGMGAVVVSCPTTERLYAGLPKDTTMAALIRSLASRIRYYEANGRWDLAVNSAEVVQI